MGAPGRTQDELACALVVFAGRFMLSWQQIEFLLKGVYLGLLVMIAWFVPQWVELASIALFTLAGLVLFLGLAAFRKIREGYRVQGRLLGFLIFLLLENPGMVYAGLLIGLSFGTMYTFNRRGEETITLESLWPVLGGGVLGAVFYNLRGVHQSMHRFWISLAMIAILIGGAAAFYHFQADLVPGEVVSLAQRRNIALLLVLGIPGFYLLTFSGLVEESEIEIAAMCAALGIALWTWISAYSPAVGAAAVLLPLGIYFVYTTKYMPALRVFKHALRGMSYRQMGQTRLALISLGRALELDSRNPMAREQLWDIHRDLDFTELQHQPDLVPFLNFDFCLERISQLLQTKPSPGALRETFKMLELIAEEDPARQPTCAYWRAVAQIHERRYEEAAKQLMSILQLPQMHTQQRQEIHFLAWYLAMYGHPEMARRVGDPLLRQPGQRMDAIAAVESQLTFAPNDPNAWDMKRQLYSELTEREYWTLVQPDQPLPRFNHEYTQQLGLALLDNAQQWRRGCEYLRIAAHGLPSQAANIYVQIARTHEKHNDHAGMWSNYMKAMQIGRRIGVDSLASAEREGLFATVKTIGELALKQNQIDAALEAFKFYSLYENAGIETYRILADLFEQNKDVWLALHCCEHALTYNAQDKDLLAKKDRYYYSITAQDLQPRLESVRKWFDPQYCRDKASWILEKFAGDFELLDWAEHLTELALVAQPGSHAARLIKARARRLRGEISEAVSVLEEIRQHRPEKFVNEEEQKAWYFTHRMLGDLYLDEKPAEAIACYLEFRKSGEAGADTSYKLGKAFEMLGDFPRAAACYEEVTAYERHPLYHEARDGLGRVKRAAPASR
jgi:tetratricopeptide (TPR) repeat protein